MVSFYYRTLIWFLFCFALMSGAVVCADRIYLKDGSVQESDRVWLSSAYVHFILNGTIGVEIRYAKEIVARVQINGIEETIVAAPSGGGPIALVQKMPKEDIKANQTGKDRPIAKTDSDAKSTTPSKVIGRKIIRDHKGIEFYAPRRNQRYWATSNSKHTTLNNALNALAKIYGRSISWVENHMGTENDLGNIHRNLIRQHEQGFSHSDLTTDNSHSISPLPLQAAETASNAVERMPVPEGLQFYNPRRKEKYWTGEEGRHHTLDAAVRTLAKQYGVTEEWIDRHMGNTNNLTTIHQNIQESLK